MCTLSTHISAFTPHRWHYIDTTYHTHASVHSYSMYNKCAHITPHTQHITSYHTPSTYTSLCIHCTGITGETCHICSIARCHAALPGSSLEAMHSHAPLHSRLASQPKVLGTQSLKVSSTSLGPLNQSCVVFSCLVMVRPGIFG